MKNVILKVTKGDILDSIDNGKVFRPCESDTTSAKLMRLGYQRVSREEVNNKWIETWELQITEED